MSWYYYEDTRAIKARLQLEIAKRRKRGEKFEALTVPQGSRKLAQTFWGRAWCDHLESHSDYEYRLPRGRSYLRQGNVYNLAIEPGVITAEVAGSALYEVRVTIQPLAKAAWKSLKKDCAGQVASLLDLLAGRLGDGMLRAVADPARGLFPKPKEIHMSCSCPDYAGMCKHVAAVLYGVGVRLDRAPDLFFVLRSVDPSELLTTAARDELDRAHGADTALAGEDLSALFGIDLATADAPPAKSPVKKPKSPKPAPRKAARAAARKAPKKKHHR
jgi:uncharacterized Zn finger protein